MKVIESTQPASVENEKSEKLPNQNKDLSTNSGNILASTHNDINIDLDSD